MTPASNRWGFLFQKRNGAGQLDEAAERRLAGFPEAKC